MAQDGRLSVLPPQTSNGILACVEVARAARRPTEAVPRRSSAQRCARPERSKPASTAKPAADRAYFFELFRGSCDDDAFLLPRPLPPRPSAAAC